MKKILIYEQAEHFRNDIESRLFLNGPDNAEIILGVNFDHMYDEIENINPDEVLINAEILETRPNWNLNIPVKCYAKKEEDLLLADDCKIPCYGVVKNTSELFQAIKSEKIMKITNDEKSENKEASMNHKPNDVQNNKNKNQNNKNRNNQNKQNNNNRNGQNNRNANTQNNQNNTQSNPNQPFDMNQMPNLSQEQMQQMMMQIFMMNMQQGNMQQNGMNPMSNTNNDADIPSENTQNNTLKKEQTILDDEEDALPSKKKEENKSVKEKLDEARRKKEEEEFAKTEAIRKNQKKLAEREVESDLGNVKKPAKVVTVYSAKGGVGKTTISCELATFLALTSHGRGKFRVCIVDYNIDFGDVLNTLSFDPEKGCMSYWASEIQSELDLGKDPEDIQFTKERISVYLQKNETDGLYALLAPFTNEDSMNITDVQLKIMLDNLIHNCDFDFVICDTGNNTRDSSVIALEKADEVLLVLTQDVNTANCNNGFLSTMNKIDFDMNKIRLVINKAQPAKTVAISTEELEEAFINPNTNSVYPCVAKINHDNEVKHMNNLGKPLVYDSSSGFTKSIGVIASEIIGEEFVLGKPEKKSFFSKFFGKKEK